MFPYGNDDNSPPDPIAPLRALGERLQTATDQIGLHMEQFVISPSFVDGVPHTVQAVFSVTPDTVRVLDEDAAAAAERAAMDEQIAGILAATSSVESQDKVEEAKRKMLAMRERFDRGEDPEG